MSNLLGLSYSTVQRTLKELKFHAYHFVRVHELLERDYPRRIRYCRWLLQRIQEDEQFLTKILWSDESTFGKHPARYNLKNNHHYAKENPQLGIVKDSQTRFSVNVWAGLLGDRVVSKEKYFYLRIACKLKMKFFSIHFFDLDLLFLNYF